jgi:membrane protein YqaA with SNARE-associated domain
LDNPAPADEQIQSCDSDNDLNTTAFTSFWDLPRLTHVCGAIIILFGLANLILLLMKADWNGLLWLFFYSIPANTAISVFPHEPAIVFCGQHFNLLLVAVVAALGNLAAGWVDYHFFTPMLKMKFTEGYRKTRAYIRAERWFDRAPFWAIVIFALTPLPFYIVKFFAFSTGYSMWKYMTGIFIGRLPRFYLLAAAGYFLKVPSWMMLTFFGGVFLVYLFFIFKAWIRSRRSRHTLEQSSGR